MGRGGKSQQMVAAAQPACHIGNMKKQLPEMVSEMGIPLPLAMARRAHFALSVSLTATRGGVCVCR